jgi:phosphoribosyl-AMP cyclohydrolase
MASQSIENLVFNDAGLIPAIVQSQETKRVLMMAWMNKESLTLTLQIGETVFFSRSRNEIWHKGKTSGNVQKVHAIEFDCDSDVILISVSEAGPACHTGLNSCFDNGQLTIGAPND